VKHDSWPPADFEARGVSFVDLCKDEFDAHFKSTEDGKWNGLTESGRYTIEMLRLNREHLIEARLLLKRLGVNILNKERRDDELAGLLCRTADPSSTS